VHPSVLMALILQPVMGFTPCEADPDVWMCLGTKPDGTLYYKYVLCFIDNVSIISIDPDGISGELKEHFNLKEVFDLAPNVNATLALPLDSLSSLMALMLGICLPKNT